MNRNKATEPNEIITEMLGALNNFEIDEINEIIN